LTTITIIGFMCCEHESKRTIDGTIETKKEDKRTIETEIDKDGDTNQAIEPVSLGEFKLTAYCSCVKCCGKWALNRPVDKNGNEVVYGAIGERLKEGYSIAVDPTVISYGTEVIINGHTYKAQDCGGAIKGNRIDVYISDHNRALEFGVEYAEVFMVSN
jgi:3D (Asp-Asp-Asp) domain-containing protein